MTQNPMEMPSFKADTCLLIGDPNQTNPINQLNQINQMSQISNVSPELGPERAESAEMNFKEHFVSLFSPV